MKLIIGLLAVGVLAMACSGGGAPSSDGDRILRLGGGDITEGEMRIDVRAFLVDPVVADGVCGALRGLSGEEAAEVIRELQQDSANVQEADPADFARAGEIVLEECRRITGD